MKILLQLLKWLLIVVILLFTLATFMGGSYLQSFIFILIIFILAYGPRRLRNRWGKTTTLMIRGTLVVILVIIQIVVFKPGPKTSIYISDSKKNDLYREYDKLLGYWPEDTQEIDLDTHYGSVHILTCGNPTNPPLLMFHAASMGAPSWAETLPAVIDHYRVYAIDNPGEGNKSQLSDARVFPGTPEEIAELYATITDSLGIGRCPVFGASNGGFIAMSYARYYPERVSSLALFGPMGLTPLTNNSILMLSITSLYPFQFLRDRVAAWALGDDPYIREKYGTWFNEIMKGTIPSVAKPVPLSREQKEFFNIPVLLFLGTKDPIVGDVDQAKNTALDFPLIEIEVMESGHLISVEKADVVNERIRKYLSE